jgi:hypothetical protein
VAWQDGLIGPLLGAYSDMYRYIGYARVGRAIVPLYPEVEGGTECGTARFRGWKGS